MKDDDFKYIQEMADAQKNRMKHFFVKTVTKGLLN